MMKNDIFVHTPADTSKNFIKWAAERREYKEKGLAIDYGCAIDEKVVPLYPGDLMAVVARPGHGKSSFMAYMAVRTAKKLAANNIDNKVVIYVSWEQPVEELEALFQSGEQFSSTDVAWGRADIEKIKENYIDRIKLPIWMMGYSIYDADKKKPQMTIERVYDSIRQINYDHGIQPALICFDYLQIIPIGRNEDRTTQVTEATIQAKHLAMEIGAPVIGGVQASRDTDNRAIQIPTMADAQWSSAIEQTADKQIGLFRPKRIFDEGELIPVGSKDNLYQVDQKLLLVRLLKQRFEEGSGLWAVGFEPQTLTMFDIKKHTLANI